jgi:hypothetical protein
MPEQIYKLSPDRDMQCYFLTPSAIAAMSGASSGGFTVSGKWRQQFDWAVVEWNRDNVFEHPALRNLPDGDLRGLTLSYTEERINAIPFESNLYPVVAWDQLRLWVPNEDGSETVYYVKVADHATPLSGSYVPASATMTLKASPGTTYRAGLAFLEQHYYYTAQAGEDLVAIAAGIAANIDDLSHDFTATSLGASVTVTWASYPNLSGANGNRITVYGFAQTPDGTSQPVDIWQQPSVSFSGGTFPSAYQVQFDFANLQGKTDDNPDPTQPIPTQNVRKVRWTWQADLQPGEFQQTEFQINITNWTVTGSNRIYSVTGPGSRRIEDTDTAVVYTGSSWTGETGNYSGSKIHVTSQPGDSCTISYGETAPHQLFLGLRRLDTGPTVTVSIDGNPAQQVYLALAGEDVLVRSPLGSYAATPHSVTLTHAGASGQPLYFDFLEIAYPSTNLPDFEPQTQLALATDWDTYHSQSLPAERTAWIIQKLGFQGRVNHYVGAIWFYEIVRTGTQYASLTVRLNPESGASNPNVVLALAATAGGLSNPATTTLIEHLVLPDDTPSNVAQALAGLINIGTNLVWASANGNQLAVTARAMGDDGNGIALELDASSQGYTLTAAANVLSGGMYGTPYDLDTSDSTYGTFCQILIAASDFWKTDLTAAPRINRAARDWHQAFFTALNGYGIDAVAAFSTELKNADPASASGIAQRYPDGTAVVLSTPAIQTNFSPIAQAFWKQVYLDMAALQVAAGVTPYLQSGEVQWWYFPKDGIGMTFYDDYTLQQFQAQYGAPMQTILTNDADPAAYPNEAAFLPTLVGDYTSAVRAALKAQYPNCRYEVLYPTDTNATPFNQLINFPASDWTAENLNCLKTESISFTGDYDLVNTTASTTLSATKGFPNPQRSHLVLISDAWTPWMKEVDIAQSQGLESVVLFAMDQYCLIGYAPPPFVKSIRSQRQG